MKKAFLSIALLIVTMCLVGCINQTKKDPEEVKIIDGEYYAKVIYVSPFLSRNVESQYISFDQNKIENIEFVEYSLKGDFFENVVVMSEEKTTLKLNENKIWLARIEIAEDIELEVGYYLTLVESTFYLYYASYSSHGGYVIDYVYTLTNADEIDSSNQKESLEYLLSVFERLKNQLNDAGYEIVLPLDIYNLKLDESIYDVMIICREQNGKKEAVEIVLYDYNKMPESEIEFAEIVYNDIKDVLYIDIEIDFTNFGNWLFMGTKEFNSEIVEMVNSLL